MIKIQSNYKFVVILWVLLMPFVAAKEFSEAVLAIKAPSIIGYKQNVVIHTSIKIDKTRDLHVSVQNMSNWKSETDVRKRVKKSGNYHFEVPISGSLKPGKYRWNLYLSKKKGDWNTSVSKSLFYEFTVIDKPNVAPEKTLTQSKLDMSKEDGIVALTWPDVVKGAQDVELVVDYRINQPRDLIIKLHNKSNWTYAGLITYPLKKSGQFKLPLSDMTSDFPSGEYRWELYITEQGKKDNIIGDKKYTSFELKTVNQNSSNEL